jgi:hypothetical protein
MSDNNNRASFIEFGDAVPVAQPNNSVFGNETGLQVRPDSVAKQDTNGNWVNAIGLASTEAHRHVAKVWQDKCISLDDAYTVIKQEATTKFDLTVPEEQVRLVEPFKLVNGTPINESGLEALRLLTGNVNNPAVPGKTVEFQLEHGYTGDLVRYINDGLNRRSADYRAGKEFRLRCRKTDDGSDIVRAIVSDRYGVIDNDEALGMVIDALPSLQDALASHWWNDGDSVIGNILLPDHMKSQPDSDYGVGISFRNSEIRKSAFTIAPFLFRAICLNGMIWGRRTSAIGVNKKHLGIINKDDLKQSVAHAIGVALTEGNDMLTLMGYSKQVTVKNVEQTIALFARDHKMTVEQGKAWHKGYLETLQEPNGEVSDRTAFGIVNGLTRSAQGYTGHMREHMETTASIILAPAIDATLDAIRKRWNTESNKASTLDARTVEQYVYIG